VKKVNGETHAVHRKAKAESAEANAVVMAAHASGFKRFNLSPEAAQHAFSVVRLAVSEEHNVDVG
jgi:hypothetical protein